MLNCFHCHQPYISRTGRGLCRNCWNNPDIRCNYPIIAGFGSKQAGITGHQKMKMGTKAKNREKELLAALQGLLKLAREIIPVREQYLKDPRVLKALGVIGQVIDSREPK